MKKIMAVVLALIMILGLCACGGAKEEQTATPTVEDLQIGFAKVDITPKFTVGIGGYGDTETRKNKDGFLDFIYVTCIAAREGTETVLLYAMDTCCINDNRADMFRQAITQAVGISGDRMFFTASHSHNSPDYLDDQYNEWVTDKLVKVTQDALADLAVSTISATSTQATGMTFVRHYIMSNGSYAGANFGDWNLTPQKHTTTADEQMQIIKFERTDESKKDVVLVNFQAHNDYATDLGYNTLSAGYVGAFRDELAKLSGCDVAFFMGASGNLNPESKISSERHNLRCKEYGVKLGQIAFEAMGNLETVGGSGIAVANNSIDVEVNHSLDGQLEQAEEIVELWKRASRDVAEVKGKEYGFSSVYEAKAIITRYQKDPTETLKQGAIRIHDLGFITGPYEMFCENGMAIKENSPFKYTFIAMGNGTYIPSDVAFDYRCYESDTAYYVKSTAKTLQEKYIEMLKSIQ